MYSYKYAFFSFLRNIKSLNYSQTEAENSLGVVALRDSGASDQSIEAERASPRDRSRLTKQGNRPGAEAQTPDAEWLLTSAAWLRLVGLPGPCDEKRAGKQGTNISLFCKIPMV